MKNDFGKFILPAVLAAIGIALIGFSYSSGQNWQFKFASFCVFLAGFIFLLSVLEVLKKTIRLALFGFLVLSAFGLTYLDYKSIKDPIDFGDEKNRRYLHVIQRLKDIRTAQIAYKGVKGKYTSDFDTLLVFIKTDSMPVIKAIGTVPDTLTEEQALKLGLVQRDTTFVSAQDSVFSAFYLNERKNSFSVDSLPYLPFGKGEKFTMNAGQIERNRVNVQVFEVIADKNKILSDLDPVLVKSETDLKVGSMVDPNTNGNWGE